jgi:uncharacterized membrane protein YphA (DoxX/SURF4 family)
VATDLFLIDHSDEQGYEYPLSLLAMALGLLISGGGQASVDRVLIGGR